MRLQLGKRALHRIAQCAAAAMLAACSDGSGPGFGTCPQTYEFGNFGCAKVEGVVRDVTGNPIAGARVSLTPAEDTPNTFDSPMDNTDASGAYSLEIHDYGTAGRDGPPPEPVAMNLRAFLTTGEDPPPMSDLIPVSLEFAPVGELPEVLEVDITINLTP
jgi:hypothetical protein